MKYKPEYFKLTGGYIKQKKNGLAAVSEIIDLLYNLGTISMGHSVTYTCGNPNCKAIFTHSLKLKRPLVCSKCGEEIDWEGIATKKIKICPQCNQQFAIDEQYCPYHLPKVALIEKEIPV